jgi:hypothetical protein
MSQIFSFELRVDPCMKHQGIGGNTFWEPPTLSLYGYEESDEWALKPILLDSIQLEDIFEAWEYWLKVKDS